MGRDGAGACLVQPNGASGGAVCCCQSLVAEDVRPRVMGQGDPLRILCAGTFREKKGLVYAIQAVALARQAGVPVKLNLVGDEAGKAGDRDTKQALLNTIRSLNLDEITSHLPFVSFRQLMDLALKSDLFLAPSVTAADGDAEGTPFVLQQMMATGMPAIATTHSTCSATPWYQSEMCPPLPGGCSTMPTILGRSRMTGWRSRADPGEVCGA